MATCKTCGKKGLFLKLNKDGNCEACEKRLQEEAERLERRRRAEEAQRRRVEAERQALLSLPLETITLNPAERKRQTGFPELKYANITPKGVFDDFVVIDTETTGLSASKDRIVELAAVRYKDGSPEKAFHTYINPKKEIPKEAQAVNHITEDMVKDAPTISEVMPAFEAFVKSSSFIIGHNLEFDLKFLFYSGSTILEGKNKLIDTIAQAKKLLKGPKYSYDEEYSQYMINDKYDYDVDDFKLETLCNYYGIINPIQHSALSDAYATGKLFLRLVKEKQE